jgi:FAD/FMN-containing dehydrogenase
MTHIDDTSIRIDESVGARTVYATDNSIYQVPPSGVVVATDAAHISALVAANRQRHAPRPITARGAGTGTNGQSLTDGLIIDVKRRMNALHMLDVDARTARVGPGIVTAQLNEQLAEHGLFWPPSTSTVNRATVGGMISTDAAGKGSLLYGRTSGHVVALEVVLDDGTVWEAAPVTVAEAERLASGTDRIGEIWRALLDIPPGPHPLP